MTTFLGEAMRSGVPATLFSKVGMLTGKSPRPFAEASIPITVTRVLRMILVSVLFPSAITIAGPLTPLHNRFKTDLLLVVAHPDDETAVGPFLAKTVFDDRKSVAILYCTRGTGGGNSVGMEQSHAMGIIREFEAREATAGLGIRKVWFLSGRDTPGQDVFRSLQEWNHGRVLEEVVRFYRLLRPEVVLTWLPAVVAGENHGDHQAAGVLATEAFDLSGDPAIFPAQVTPAREPMDIGNATEGLVPWQPKKLYYVSDASEKIVADGPAFDPFSVSPSQGVPYIELAARLHIPHATQGEVSHPAREAISGGDYRALGGWLERFGLIFGKAAVPCSAVGGVFDGTQETARYSPRLPRSVPASPPGLTLVFGGAFEYYSTFYGAHGLGHLSGLVKPRLEVTAGSYFHVPLVIRNGTPDSVAVTLRAVLPGGWEDAGGSGRYTAGPGDSVPAQAFVRTPGETTARFIPLRWEAGVRGGKTAAVEIGIRLVEWALPQ